MIDIKPVPNEYIPREKIAVDFTDLNGGLPIQGGWGYSKETACVICVNDPLVDPEVSFEGIKIEYQFAEKRIYEEMVICRPEGNGFSAIEWGIVRQELVEEGDRQYDKLIFEIRAYHEADWKELEEEYNGPNGISSMGFNWAAFEMKKEEKRIHFEREFWFDITSFYGKGVFVPGPEFGYQDPDKKDKQSFTDKFKNFIKR